MIFAGAGFAGHAQWNVQTDMNESRSQHVAVTLNSGDILVAGGWDGSVNLSTAEVYNYTSDTWTGTINDMTSAHATGAAAKLADGKVLVISGWDGTINTTTCDLYNPATNNWSATGSMAYGRSYHTATLLNDGRVLVAGGYTGAVNTQVCEIYNPAMGTWSQTDSLAIGRSYHTATLLNDGRVLVAGGYNPAEGFQLTSAEIFDPTTNTWSTAPSMSDPRAWHSASLLSDGKVMVAGGEFFTGATPYAYEGLESAEAYNATTNTWTALADMPGGLSYNQQYTLSGNRVMVVAGLANTDYGSGFTSAPGVTYLYNVSANTWTSAAMNIDARKEFAGSLLSGDKLLVCGGGTTTTEVYSTPVSVGEILADEAMQVYPNPSSGIFNISVKGENMETIIVTDLSGQQVFVSTNVNSTSANIDLGTVAKGMYNVKVSTAKGVAVKRISII